jgi:hypothetical protein
MGEKDKRFRSRKWIGVVYVMVFNLVYLAAQIILAKVGSQIDLHVIYVVALTFAMVAGYWGINYLDQKLTTPGEPRGPRQVIQNIQATAQAVEDLAASAVGFQSGENK